MGKTKAEGNFPSADVAQQPQPQESLQQPPLPQLPQPLPLPPQITSTMIRMMIHHQLLPKAQIPELLQDIESTSQKDFGAVIAHSMLCSPAGLVRSAGRIERVERNKCVAHLFPAGEQRIEDRRIGL